jgi:hypothetical protein
MCVLTGALLGALLFEEVVGRPGYLVEYECPECGQRRKLQWQDTPPRCEADRKGKKHPPREMPAFTVIKSTNP